MTSQSARWTQPGLVAHPEQLAGTRVVALLDGPGEGGRSVQAWTPSGLDVEVLLDRGFDLHAVRYRGRSIGWAGPSGRKTRVAYEPGGFGWLRTFHGGLCVTCGLEHFGNPATVDGAQHLPPTPREIDAGEHGRISHQAADLVTRDVVWDDPEPHVLLVGEVRQAALYAEQLVLRRTIRIGLDRARIDVRDVVRNVGGLPTSHALLYHLNFGYPLILPGSLVHMRTTEGETTAEVAPLTPDAAEVVTPHELLADDAGWARVRIESPTGDLATTLRHRTDTLPAFFLWLLPRSGVNVAGLAPANTWDVEQAPRLAAGATLTYEYELEFSDGRG